MPCTVSVTEALIFTYSYTSTAVYNIVHCKFQRWVKFSQHCQQGDKCSVILISSQKILFTCPRHIQYHHFIDLHLCLLKLWTCFYSRTPGYIRNCTIVCGYLYFWCDYPSAHQHRLLYFP